MYTPAIRTPSECSVNGFGVPVDGAVSVEEPLLPPPPLKIPLSIEDQEEGLRAEEELRNLRSEWSAGILSIQWLDIAFPALCPILPSLSLFQLSIAEISGEMMMLLVLTLRGILGLSRLWTWNFRPLIC